MVVRVEPDPQVKSGSCDQCGGTTFMIVGFLYLDESAYGAYYVDWCEGDHDERVATITVSLGESWGDDDSTAADRRVAFCIDYRCEGMGLADSPLRDRPELLGRFVGREALADDGVEHLWHFADHIVDDDERATAVSAWLCGERPSASPF